MAHLGTLRAVKASDSCTLLKDFHIFCKSHFVTIFVDLGLHFGMFWDPKLALFGDQKSIKHLFIFGIHFLSILVPSWVPKCTPNPPKSCALIGFGVFFWISIQISIIFLITVWKGQNTENGSSWDPRHRSSTVNMHTKMKFSYFHKIAI